VLPRFDAARSFAVLGDEAITWLPAVPTMYAAWAAAAEAGGLREPPALRWCLSAGAPLPDQLAHRAEQCLGVELRQGYGLTEATFATLNAPPDARVIGSVGKPAWGIELRVVDERGADVQPGSEGEVWVRGQNVMSRYLHDADATAAVQHDGFVASGDIGRVDASGRLTIVDRIKDLIIRGGNNVYPSEVEDALSLHPGVAQVAVVGRPDAYYGEEVVAVVLPRPGAQLTAEQLMAFARERVARTKVPREVALVDALPLGPSGKVLKRELRRWLSDGRLELIGKGKSG
jgi:long-chain acyl-CoA synthetase